MEVAALSLLLLLDSLNSASAPVSVTVSPRRSQFFKYESFSVSCEEEEEEVTGWRVMKRMKDGEVFVCPSSCSVQAAFPFTDSGQYWCESGLGQTSNTINITVTADSVILVAPVLPVMEGDHVTLSCRTKMASSSSLPAGFYRDGVLISSSATGNMTILNFSKGDEGLYRCDGSPDSWILLTATPTGQEPPPSMSVSTLVRHLVVGAPYLLSTILLGLVYRDRGRAQHTSKATPTSNDVVMETIA